jgi:PAS domain-containing protein
MYASQQMTALLGLMQVDVIGEPFSSVIHPDDKKDFMLLLKDKTTCSHLIRMKDTLSFNTRDSGNHLWRVMHLFALGHTSKEGMSFTVFECEPFDKVPILELVIGSSTEVFMHVPTRTAVSVDWKFELITGINKDDIVGTNPVLLYGFPSEVEAFEESRQKALHAVLSTGEWWHVPSRILSGYGEWYWARLHLKANKIRNGELLEMKCRTIILGPYKPEEAYNLTRNHQQPLPSVSTHHVAVSLPTPPSSHSSTDKTISQGPSEVSTPSPQSLCLSSIDSGSVDVLGTRVSVEGTASSLPGMSNIVLTGSPKAEPSLNQALVNCEADLLSTQVHELLQVPPAPVQHDMTEECTHCHELLDFILEEQLCQ